MSQEPRGKIKEFTDLFAWQEGHKVVIRIYSLTKGFPKEEIFGIVSQMRRAAVSITSNIAEGFGRHSYRERVQFFYLAQGSLVELKNQVIISRDVGYISESEYLELHRSLESAHKTLQGLIKSSKALIAPAS